MIFYFDKTNSLSSLSSVKQGAKFPNFSKIPLFPFGEPFELFTALFQKSLHFSLVRHLCQVLYLVFSSWLPIWQVFCTYRCIQNELHCQDLETFILDHHWSKFPYNWWGRLHLHYLMALLLHFHILLHPHSQVSHWNHL